MAEGERGLDHGRGSSAGDSGRVAPNCVAVVPAFMAEGTLARTLESLLVANADVVRRVVVVASPGDGSAEVAERYPEVETIRLSKRVSAGRARNLGRLAAGKADYLLFVDADCRLAFGGARKLRDACERRGLAAAGSPIRPSERAGVAWIRHLLEFKDFEAGVRTRRPWMLPSAALLCRADAFDRVGGFPDLWPGEDLVFCDRLRECGLAIDRVDTTAADHEHPAGVARMLSHQYRLGATSAVARRATGMTGVRFTERRWSVPALFFGRLARSVHWVFAESPRDLGRLLAYFPLIVTGLLSWSAGFARGSVRGDVDGGAWRGV